MKPQSSSSNNKIPMSVKGRKKLLAPLNIKNNNQSLISTSTKDSIESKKINSSRDYLEYENDKKEDFIFLSKLSEREKTFFEVRAADIYNFLKELNLIRYIESFINDGFETKEDLMEIQEDYFLENKNFNKNQQKNESISMSTNNSINKSTTINKETGIEDFPLENKINENNNDNKSECNFIEIGIGNGDINNYYLTNKINRCWTCFNKLKDKNYIEVKYEESMITRIVRFCCEKCKNKFELNIYEICDNCKIKYDKSKGEYIFQDKHFHSQKCLDEFINKNNINKNEINNNEIIQEEEQEEQEDIYDPMNDF